MTGSVPKARRTIVDAAIDAGVDRVLQESVSMLYSGSRR